MLPGSGELKRRGERASVRAMQGSLRLLACGLLVTAGGCTHKGLMGLAPGETLKQATARFHPKKGTATFAKGAWNSGMGRLVATMEGGVPTKAVLWTKGKKVVGFQLTFQDDALRKGGLIPATYRYDLGQRQAPDGSAGPFVDDQVKIRAKGGTLYEVVEAGPRFEVGRYSEAGLGAAAKDCAGAAKVMAKVRAAVSTTLGEDGLAPGPDRDHAIERLRLVAASAQLACPKGSGVLTGAGDLLLAIGHANPAKARYQAALKANAHWGAYGPADAHGGLGLIAARYRQMQVAAGQMARAIRLAQAPADKARWARRWADALHQTEDWAGAAHYYRVYLDALAKGAGGQPADTARVYARLVRSTLETVHGCKPAAGDLAQGLALEGVPDKARGSLLAAKAFYLLACKPKEKKEAYRVLGQAVKLNPLKAADWADVTGYYDRESNDATVLKIMVQQGWLDRSGIRAAKAYQKMERAAVR